MSNKAQYSFLDGYNFGCASGDYPCLLNKFNSGALYSQIVANMTTNTAMTDSRINPTTGLPRDPTPVNRNALRSDYGWDNAFQGPRAVRFGFKFTF